MIRTALFVIVALFATSTAQAQCRQALALGFDVSGSVDEEEYRLQLDGLATALADPEVRHAFLITPHTPVRLMMFEWSGPRDQRIVLPWTDIQDDTDLDALIATLQNTLPARARDNDTAIADAMIFGARELLQHQDCWLRTLDISGDGPDNIGLHPQSVTEDVLGDITINGLVIVPNSRANVSKNRSKSETLLSYYMIHVIRGPGAFVEAAADHRDFADAMRRKLIRELRLPNLSWLSLAPPHLLRQ